MSLFSRKSKVSSNEIDQVLISKYDSEIEKLLANEYLTYDSEEWQKVSISFFSKLEKRFTKGDINVLHILNKVIREEYECETDRISKLQELALLVMFNHPELSVEPLLAMVRDENGNPVFPMNYNTYCLGYVDRILNTLQDIALTGYQYEKLLYEFIRIGAKAEKEISKETDRHAIDAVHGYAIFNIKQQFYDSSEEMIEALPPLTDNEKEFLRIRKYPI